MEVFTGLTRSSITIRLIPIRKFRDLNSLDTARIAALADVEVLHDASHCMHKEVANSNSLRRTRSQRIHNLRINVAPLNFSIGDYFMIRTHNKKIHKLQSKWRDPMRAK